MKISDDCLHVIELVNHAEAIIESRERQAPDVWAMTAFSRHRAIELLGRVQPLDGRDLHVDPVALLEAAVEAADKLAVPVEDLAWRLALVEAVRAVLADVRMVCDARDL